MRLYLTNTANTRVFNVALPGARMKLVGGDSGRVEREEFVEEVVLAPSERVVRRRALRRSRASSRSSTARPTAPTRSRRSRSARSRADAVARRSSSTTLRTNAELVAERERIAPYLDAPPDKTLAFVAEMDMGAPEGAGPSTPARCIPRSSATSPATARSAA